MSDITPSGQSYATSGARRFRKRPVEVDALLYPDERGDRMIGIMQGIAWWLEDDFGGVEFVDDVPCIIVKTLEGQHVASPGDWIIRGIHGEHYPCKPDIFWKTYEDVDVS